MNKQVTLNSELKAFNLFKNAIAETKLERANAPFNSKYEILGILSKEIHALQHAASNPASAQFDTILLEILIASYWGIASNNVPQK